MLGSDAAILVASPAGQRLTEGAAAVHGKAALSSDGARRGVASAGAVPALLRAARRTGRRLGGEHRSAGRAELLDRDELEPAVGARRCGRGDRSAAGGAGLEGFAFSTSASATTTGAGLHQDALDYAASEL